MCYEGNIVTVLERVAQNCAMRGIFDEILFPLASSLIFAHSLPALFFARVSDFLDARVSLGLVEVLIFLGLTFGLHLGLIVMC